MANRNEVVVSLMSKPKVCIYIPIDSSGESQGIDLEGDLTRGTGSDGLVPTA